MELIRWRTGFCTGIASVDHEHQMLIRLINDIHEMSEPPVRDIAAGAGQHQGNAFLGRLHDAIAAHFALEEKIMRDQRHSGYTEHKADHERLLDDIRDIMEQYQGGEFAGRREALSERLDAWFFQHFSTCDRRFHQDTSVGHTA